MAERLVMVSDMWGTKKGLWITSYLGYLQQYFDIVFYDSQHLANIDLTINTEENIHKAFVDGGIDTAAACLLKKEKMIPSHYLAFSTGGTIAWKAALMGLPMKSLYTVSATRIRLENSRPQIPTTLIYGSNDKFIPSDNWFERLGVEKESIKNFGHTLYTDEKIIQKVCLNLLENVTHTQIRKKAI
ncbi:MAG: hypothetical protein QM485_16390 [Flavobacteriaceae bacterium]